jgi:hypothetical protein
MRIHPLHCLFSVATVGLLTGCYNLTLKDYKGVDAGEDAWTSYGIEVGPDQAIHGDGDAAADVISGTGGHAGAGGATGSAGGAAGGDAGNPDAPSPTSTCAANQSNDVAELALAWVTIVGLMVRTGLMMSEGMRSRL